MSVPIGTILAYGAKVDGTARGQLEREGWLICNGDEVSRDDYSELADRIGGLYGSVDDPRQFKLPDLRGLFVRGVDETGEVDPNAEDRFLYEGKDKTKAKVGAQVGSLQDDAMQSHRHHDRVASKIATPDSAPDFFSVNHYYSEEPEKDDGNPLPTTAGEIRHGKETRPKNIYVNWIIKAKNV